MNILSATAFAVPTVRKLTAFYSRNKPRHHRVGVPSERSFTPSSSHAPCFGSEIAMAKTRLALLLLLGSFVTSSAFVVRSLPSRKSRHAVSRLHLAKKQDSEEMNPVTKASWYGVELFGKVFGDKSNLATESASDNVDTSQPPQSMKETFQRIQLDNDREYFLSGNVDTLIYDENCVFADPFVSFSGRDRFVENLQNLGSFITKYSAKMIDYTEQEAIVKTKVMVKLELNLPWKPVLAWPWGVTYDIDPDTFLVTNHKETWDIEPLEVRSRAVPC